MKISRLISACVIGIVVLSIYFVGYQDGMHDEDSQLLPSAQAAGGRAVQTGWSPTKPYPTHEVYYPGTEELGPDEMRVIACGTGMPMPRLKQAAACFVIELGNGDKFIFDMGNGSLGRIDALGIPRDYLDKVFLTHLHLDHMGDLPAFY